MELTKTVKDKTFDDYFTEVDHSESISEDRPGSMRLFYLNVRSGKIKIADLEKFTMLNIGRYVFSRAKQEQYAKTGNLDAVMKQARRLYRKLGAAVAKGTGTELGDIMIYAFLEEKLKAYKLLSKIELSTDAEQYLSEAEGIHFLCSDGTSGSYNQMVFGASNIVGEIKDAIDQAFEIIKKISAHEDDEVYMIEKTVLDRFYDEDDLAVLKEYVVPEEGKKAKYAISYGVFLGYNFGILPTGRSDDELLDIMQEKLEQDAQQHAAYISQKIKDCGLENHAFYFYLLPLNDAEAEKKTIMQHVLDGDVDL